MHWAPLRQPNTKRREPLLISISQGRMSGPWDQVLREHQVCAATWVRDGSGQVTKPRITGEENGDSSWGEHSELQGECRGRVRQGGSLIQSRS